MSWSKPHQISAEYACDADVARWRRDEDVARANYIAAARWEEKALADVGGGDPESFGILAISSAALYFKGAEFSQAEKIAAYALSRTFLPEASKRQLIEIVDAVRRQRGARTGLAQPESQVEPAERR